MSRVHMVRLAKFGAPSATAEAYRRPSAFLRQLQELSPQPRLSGTTPARKNFVLLMYMDALAIVTAITSALAAVGALFNGWQIVPLAGRVDALETDVRSINTRIDNILLADRRNP